MCRCICCIHLFYDSFLFLLLLLSSCLFIPVLYSTCLFMGQRQIFRRQYDVKLILHLLMMIVLEGICFEQLCVQLLFS